MSTPANKSTEKEVFNNEYKTSGCVYKGEQLALLKEAFYSQLNKEISDYNKRQEDTSNDKSSIKKITFEELKKYLDDFVFGSEMFAEHYDSMGKTYSFNKSYSDIVIELYQNEFELSASSELVKLLRKLFNQLDYEVTEFNEEDRFGGYELCSVDLKLELLLNYKGGKKLHESYDNLVRRFKFSKSFTEVSNMSLYHDMNVEGKKVSSDSDFEIEESKTKSSERTVGDVFSSLSFAEREELTLVVELVILRRESGMTVKDLAKKSGVSKKYIKGLEGSTKKFNLKKVIKLADALGMQLKFVKR